MFKKICFHEYRYIGYAHLVAMPNHERGISVLLKCKKCGKSKCIYYIEPFEEKEE